MTLLDIASQDATTLETAPTRYIEGRGIRFAYRHLSQAPLVRQTARRERRRSSHASASGYRERFS